MSISTPSVRSFAYGIGCSLGDTVVAYTFTAARWGVLAYDFLASEEAIATYKWLGVMTIALAQLAGVSLVWVYAHISQYLDRYVQSCVQEPPVVPVDAVPSVVEEVDPFDLTVNPLDIPVVQDSPAPTVFTVSTPPAGIPSRDALRKEAVSSRREAAAQAMAKAAAEAAAKAAPPAPPASKARSKRGGGAAAAKALQKGMSGASDTL